MKMSISLPVQSSRHFKTPIFLHLTDFLVMAPYPIFLKALKTVIMRNLMLLTESEQFKHISALLVCNSSKTEVIQFSSRFFKNLIHHQTEFVILVSI